MSIGSSILQTVLSGLMLRTLYKSDQKQANSPTPVDEKINWTAGTRTIFCTMPAEKMIYADASDNPVNLVENNPEEIIKCLV